MTNEIPNSPRRNGMVCWQIRHERQPDGSFKMRRVYAMPDGVAPMQTDDDGMNYLDSPGSGHHGELKPKVVRGVIRSQEKLL